MELQTISQISKLFGISTRTLRYYEQIGLIQPVKKEDFAYRAYDNATVRRLRQIIVLRKLRIPLKQITEILKSEDAVIAIRAFEQNLGEIEDEITALTTIRSITRTLLEQLRQQKKLRLLNDKRLLELVDSLTVSKINFREEKTMEDLNMAFRKLNKLTDQDVRIVYLPPAAVASVYAMGTEPGPEQETAELANQFYRDTDLQSAYPASRHYGFNNPDEPVHGEGHGYERYIIIPDDMDVPPPFTKKRFLGGMYAALMIPMGAWDEWLRLHEWVVNSERYDFRWGTIDGVCGWLEEHLNCWDWDWQASGENENRQIDLLIPIKEK